MCASYYFSFLLNRVNVAYPIKIPSIRSAMNGQFFLRPAPFTLRLYRRVNGVFRSQPGSYSQLPILRARLVKNTFGPADVEYAADAKAGHVAGRLFWRPAVFLYPLQHLLGEMCGDHPMTAHGAEF